MAMLFKLRSSLPLRVADHPNLMQVMGEHANGSPRIEVWDRTTHSWVRTFWHHQIDGAIKADRVFLCRRFGVEYCEDLEVFVRMAREQRIAHAVSSMVRELPE